MGCEMGRIKVVMNKPVYLGQAILDLSKIVMYEFHYDYMTQKYSSDRLQLCYMDTDSLVYRIQTEDFHEDISEDVRAIGSMLLGIFQTGTPRGTAHSEDFS